MGQHRTPRRSRPLLTDLRWGLGRALVFATALSAWVLLLSALRGSPRFDRYGMTAWQIAATYYAVGAVGGTLLGLWRPFTRTRAGATAVGALVGTVFYTGVGISMDGGLSRSALVGGMVIGVPMGGFLAFRSWKGA